MRNKGEAVTSDQTQEKNTCTNTSQDTAGAGIPTEGNNQLKFVLQQENGQS